ncbi:hypothetical protein QVD17_16311 [Tagetes erecta]|uniref:Uncharacterized protein n=1 Tax=Tagetes erecta TaxID=13708 RepID=A0AAD8NTF0_TARER|nr:hypothetical protein QVD17_16311 [Tagetes erecta]
MVDYGVSLVIDGGLRRLSRREGGWRRLMVVRWWLVTAVRGEGRGWGRRGWGRRVKSALCTSQARAFFAPLAEALVPPSRLECALRL